MKTVTIQPAIYSFDIDSSRHVSNITYIRWMEMGRNRLMEEVGMAVHKIEEEGFAPVLTRTEISYKKPLYMGDTVRIELFLAKFKKISGTIQFNFYNQDDDLVAEANQDALFFHLDTKRPYRLTDEQRQKFTGYLMQE